MHTLASLALAATVLTACGGGGSDSPGTAVVPPANGSYAGTYVCSTRVVDAAFTAVLTTANGNFSSCHGDVDNHTVTFTCTGSILADGTFKVNSIDSKNQTGVYTGEASATAVSGTFTVSNGVAGAFTCTH